MMNAIERYGIENRFNGFIKDRTYTRRRHMGMVVIPPCGSIAHPRNAILSKKRECEVNHFCRRGAFHEGFSNLLALLGMRD
jgi:hypothetical protein